MRDVRSFLQAVLIGGFVGAAPFLWFTIGLSTYAFDKSDGGRVSDFAQALWFALLPLTISCAIVLAAAIMIGLPLTWFLRRRGYASGGVYIVSGAWTGLLISIVALLLAGISDAYWFALLGAFSGAATSGSWSRSMRRLELSSNIPADTKSPLPAGERVG
ncbi:hypothetical protein ACQR50_02475 [Sphingomonas sp. Xoc002]|uniref:hypothetical protein n=1 Tax=Sphingomonas sp. Xoc002 TaxID=2837624 RepID=UPI003D164B08